MNDYLPTQKTKEGDIVSGFEMKAMSEISVKLDILGLKTLSIIDEVCNEVGIKMKDIDYDSQEIYDYLQKFENGFGVFPLEGWARFSGKSCKACKYWRTF